MGKGKLMVFKACLLTIVVLAVSLTRVGNLSAQTKNDAKIGNEWVKTELYLGRSTSGGQKITQMQFNNFLNRVVTKYFPKGLTVYDAYGQMQEQDKVITEQATWVIAIVHEKTQENEDGISTVISEYRKQFQNPDVMCTAFPVKAQFYTHK